MDKTIIKQGASVSCLSSSISWSAILAGLIVGLMAETLLNLLGVGFGFTAFTPSTAVVSKIGIGTIVWFVVCGIIAMAAAGWVAGRFCGVGCKITGALHGIIAWALATFFSFIFMATVTGVLVGGMATLVERTVTLTGQGALSVGQTASQVAPEVAAQAKEIFPDVNAAINEVKQQADQILNNFKKDSEQVSSEIKNQLRTDLSTLLTADGENEKAAARQKVVELLAQNTNMDQEQIDKTINDWQQKYAQLKEQLNQKLETAKQKTIESGTQVVNLLGSLALTTFFVLLLSAIAAAIGGAYGAKRIEGEI